jgi:hypothetical protein
MATKKVRKKKEAIKPAKTSAPTPAALPVPSPPMIRFDEFQHRSGIRPEHFSGFSRYISLQYGPDTQERKTFEDWKNAYDKYLNRPVIG